MIQKIFTSKTTFEELSIPEEQQYSIIANSQGQLSAVPQGDFELKRKLTFIQASTSTVAADAIKIATTSAGNYTPVAGDLIELTLTFANTTNTMGVNIDGSGVKQVFIGGVQATAVASGGTKHLYIYNGAQYELFGSTRNSDTNTTYNSTTLGTTVNTAATLTPTVNRMVIDNYNGTSVFTLPTSKAIGSVFLFYKNGTGSIQIRPGTGDFIATLDGATTIGNDGNITINQGSWIMLRTKVANSITYVENMSPNAVVSATTEGNWNIGASGDFIPYTNASQNVDLNEKNLTNVGTFRSKRIQNPDNLVVKTDKNKTNYLMELTDGTPLIVHQTEVTNPFNLISTPTDNFGFGIGALEENIGQKTIGIGLSALSENRGHFSIGIGENSLHENLGSTVTGIGRNALSKNTSHYVIGIGENIMEYNAAGASIGIGDSSLQYNFGRDVIGIGRMMMRYNTGIQSINIGGESMSYNTGNDVIGIGRDSLRYNDSSSLISIGSNSLNDPQPDTPKEKTFDYDDIDIPNKRIYIPSHGFGESGFINLIFTQGTEPIPSGFDNLYDGQAYQFMLSSDGDYIYWSTVIDGTSYERRTVNITGQGTGTGHKFTPIVKRNNSISIGNSISWSDITKDNQTVIKGVEILALDSTIASIDAASDNVLVTKEWVNSQDFGTQTLSDSTSNLIVSNTVQRAALTGDVTASQNSNATTIANNAVTTNKILNSAVTHAKYQNIATQRILGRGASGTGNVQELTLGANISITSSGVINVSSGAQTLHDVLSTGNTAVDLNMILVFEETKRVEISGGMMYSIDLGKGIYTTQMFDRFRIGFRDDYHDITAHDFSGIRTHLLQDKDGTLAHLEDIASSLGDYVPLSGTEVGKPLTGNIVVDASNDRVGFITETENRFIGITDDGLNALRASDSYDYSHLEQNPGLIELYTRNNNNQFSRIQTSPTSILLRSMHNQSNNGNSGELTINNYEFRFDSKIDHGDEFDGSLYYNAEEGFYIYNNKGGYLNLTRSGLSGYYNTKTYTLSKNANDAGASRLLFPDSGNTQRRIPVSVNGVYANQQGEITIPTGGNYVPIDGNMTINGTKTFSTIPVLPSSNPTSANQAVRKAYVDAQKTAVNSFSGNLTLAANHNGNILIETTLGTLNIPASLSADFVSCAIFLTGTSLTFTTASGVLVTSYLPGSITQLNTTVRRASLIRTGTNQYLLI